MVARMLLPIAGGSPSLWNTSMVFFQLALLAGYAYAHVSTNRLGMARHPISQVALLAVGGSRPEFRRPGMGRRVEAAVDRWPVVD